MSLPELEALVSQLPPADLTAFARWFEEYLVEARGEPRGAGTPDEPAPFDARELDEMIAADITLGDVIRAIDRPRA